MKILLVSPPSDFNDQTIAALQKTEISFRYINDRKNFIIPIPGKFIWKIIRRVNYLRELNNKLLHRNILNIAREYQPDIIIFNKVLTVKSHLLEKLSQMGIKLVNWFPENSENEPYKSWIKNHASSFDYFFSFDSRIESLNNSQIKTKFHYLPFGVDVEAFSSVKVSEEDKKKYACEVCFVGAYYPEREETLKQLTHLDLRIYGWKGWETSSLKKYYCGPLNFRESVKVYQSSKISLNINILPVINGVNFKTFEIPASGGFQISDYRPDVDRLFTDGKEIVIFKDSQDLKEKIDLYLVHEKERRQVIQDAQVKISTDHTMESRIAHMLKIISL